MITVIKIILLLLTSMLLFRYYVGTIINLGINSLKSYIFVALCFVIIFILGKFMNGGFLNKRRKNKLKKL